MGAQSLLDPALRQDSPRDVAVVEREHLGADDLIGLVTLPGDDDRIARLGPGERGPDRDGAVGLGRVAARAGPGPPDADQDLADDRLRPLRAGIVGGHPPAVAEPCGGLAHDRPLAAVAVAAAA